MGKKIGDDLNFNPTKLEKATAKFNPHDHSRGGMIPISLEEQLVPGRLGIAIPPSGEDRMNRRGFEDRYQNDETGRMACDPKILLKRVDWVPPGIWFPRGRWRKISEVNGTDKIQPLRREIHNSHKV